MYELMSRNAKLSAAYTRVRAQVWLLVVVELWGMHLVLHRHRQSSRHMYTSINSIAVLLAAIPAISNGWFHTPRLIVAFPAQ